MNNENIVLQILCKVTLLTTTRASILIAINTSTGSISTYSICTTAVWTTYNKLVNLGQLITSLLPLESPPVEQYNAVAELMRLRSLICIEPLLETKDTSLKEKFLKG